MLTGVCSENCSYCFVKSSPNYQKVSGDIDTNRAERQLRELLRTKDISGVEVVGGETFEKPKLIAWVLDFIHSINPKLPISFFSNALSNIEEVFAIVSQYNNLSFNFSYDGCNSIRNKGNYQQVKDTVKLFQRSFPVNIRWSVNQEDIPYLFEHYQEIYELGIETPIFFPMKYFDYSSQDIELFAQEFQKILKFCVNKKIDFHGLFKTKYYHCGGKTEFYCPEEITLLPSNQWTTCYVDYSSSGFPTEKEAANLREFDQQAKEIISIPNRCKKCLDIFGGCNKCPGNLKQYRRITGKNYNFSYCDLIARLAKLFINQKLGLNPKAEFKFYYGDKIHTEIKKEGKEIIKIEKVKGESDVE